MSEEINEGQFGILYQEMLKNGRWRPISRDVNGYTIKLINPRTEDYIKALDAIELTFQLNELDDVIYLNGRPLTDVRESIVINWCLDLGLKGRDRVQHTINEVAYRNKFNPIKSYLEMLPEWDGRDHIANLQSHIVCKEQYLANLIMRKWLIGAVAKVLEQGQNYMLVLDGEQNAGKSYFAAWLCSGLPKYFLESAISSNKDMFVNLMGYWIWEVGELQASTRKADREAIKDFVTRKIINIRKPYDRYNTVKPATASLIGTINEDGAGFLNDPTGTRRFGVINIQSIDWKYSEEINVDQLWAQALHLYRSGEGWQLSVDERALQQEFNRDYASTDIVAEMLHKWYEFGDFDEPLATVDIVLNLMDKGLTGNQRHNTMLLAAELKRMGCARKRHNYGVRYYGIRSREVTPDDIQL